MKNLLFLTAVLALLFASSVNALEPGDTLWTRIYGGWLAEKGQCVRQTLDGGYILTGLTASFGPGGGNVWLMKTDAKGDSVWTRVFGGAGEDYGFHVQQTADSGYMVAGHTSSFGEGNSDIYLIKTEANGDTLRGGRNLGTRTYGGPDWEKCYSAQQTTDGGYIMAGRTKSFGMGGYDFYVVKADDRGDVIWERTYGGTADDKGFSIQQTPDGGYIIAGDTRSFGAGGDDVWLLKVAGEAPQPDVSIEIVPDDPPVTVPQGGSFGFTGNLTNNTEEPQVTDAWTMAIGPEKEVYGPFKEFSDVELDLFETRTAHFNQRVPNLAPLGFYSYIAYCGDYPSTVVDSSSFQIEVVQGVFTGTEDLGWLLTGSFDRGEDFVSVPSDFALLSNYPNPFNAQTVIEYQLPVASTVKLEVYNLLGENVATLVNGEEEAGYRSVSWDASEVSSGVYFYKLTASDYTETMRMILVK